MVEEPILKLDSAVAEKLREINRPLFPFALQQYLQDLKKCRRFIIQTMFLKGYNDTADDLDRWRQTLREIQPKEVQIYTVSRTPATPGLQPLGKEELERIAKETTAILGLPVHPYT